MISIEQAVDNYLRDLAVGQSDQTVQTYSQGLARFKEFLLSISHSPADPAPSLSVDDALGCAQWLTSDRVSEAGPIAKATLRTYLASISQFYAFLLRENIVDLSASELERMRNAYKHYRRGYNRPLPKLPPEEAVRALLTAAHDSESQPKNPPLELARLRNIAMLEALRSSGMRVGELVKLRRDDLDYRAHSARVIGKGNKERVVYFDDNAWHAIESYLKERADGAKGRALYQLPVFARHDRGAGKETKPLTIETVRKVFAKLSRVAEIDVTLTPHSMRHAFATKILESTGDLAVVQDMLGHASPVTTRVYAKVSNKKIREAHRAAFNYGKSDSESENK